MDINLLVVQSPAHRIRRIAPYLAIAVLFLLSVLFDSEAWWSYRDILQLQSSLSVSQTALEQAEDEVIRLQGQLGVSTTGLQMPPVTPMDERYTQAQQLLHGAQVEQLTWTPQALQVQATVPDFAALGRVLAGWQRSPDIASVKLGAMQQVSVNQRTVVQFSLQAVWRGTTS